MAAFLRHHAGDDLAAYAILLAFVYIACLALSVAARITAVPAEQVRPSAAAGPELTPAEINRSRPISQQTSDDRKSNRAVAPGVLQSAPKPIKPLVTAAPPQPQAKAQVRAALPFRSPPRKSQLPAAGVLQERVTREQVVRRALPEIPVKDRGMVRGKATVVVSVVANQSGDVTEAIVEESDSPFFDRLVMEAAVKWRFVPSKTVSSREYFLRFEITGTEAEATLQVSRELSLRKEPSSLLSRKYVNKAGRAVAVHTNNRCGGRADGAVWTSAPGCIFDYRQD